MRLPNLSTTSVLYHMIYCLSRIIFKQFVKFFTPFVLP
nr:MAG TPA: hypothetical protein [Caudoviricetes sp.]